MVPSPLGGALFFLCSLTWTHGITLMPTLKPKLISSGDLSHIVGICTDGGI